MYIYIYIHIYKNAYMYTQEQLNLGKAARSTSLTDEERASVKGLGMLTLKPIIYATNVADADLAGTLVCVCVCVCVCVGLHTQCYLTF